MGDLKTVTNNVSFRLKRHEYHASPFTDYHRIQFLYWPLYPYPLSPYPEYSKKLQAFMTIFIHFDVRYFNSFHATSLFLYFLKISENQVIRSFFKLVMNLIKKLREMRRKNSHGNWQQNVQSLAQRQYYVF